MSTINGLLLLGGMLLFVSVLASTLSARLGMPLLLLFLLVGMFAGEDGLGGIRFSDFSTAMFIGQLALAIILLDGGLRTRLATLRVALAPAAVLASWGVVATALSLAVFATWLFAVDWRVGLLMAAIVGSTDAAAVFSLLRNSGVRLNDRVKSTLELESGANDPMAILLVTMLVELILSPGERDGWAYAVMLLQQLAFGALFGLIGGYVLSSLLARLNLAEGLYALLIVSGGLLVFSITNMLGGSGFLAVYLAGLVIGNRRCHATEHVLRVMDGLAWLAQAGMFLVLGLLVTPTALLDNAWHAVAIAVFLMLVARPLAVVTSLLPFHFSRREIAYVSWVGLRGAVPIVVAIYPLTMGVPESKLLFEVAFAVVLVSLLVQGATVPVAARWLGVVVPPRDEPVDRLEVWVGRNAALDLIEYRVGQGSWAQGMRPDELVAEKSGEGSRLAAVLRNGSLLALGPEVTLQAGDLVWLTAPEDKVDSLAAVFAGRADNELSRNAAFFGDFSVAADCAAMDLAMAYGFQLPEQANGLNVGAFIEQQLDRPAVEGDALSLGSVVLTVRKTDLRGRVESVGVKLPGRA